MTTVAHPPHKGYRTIRLPSSESEYGRFLTALPYAKDRLKALVADAKQSWLQGARMSLAISATQDGLVGASVALSAAEADVENAYGVCASAGLGCR